MSSTKRLQSSKKGKRAWRKNIDLEDIEKDLEERRQDLIAHGKPVEELEAADLFYIDDEEDETIKKRMRKNNMKPLKSLEILNNGLRSKIEALGKPRKSKVEGVSHKEIHRLMKLAGKVVGVDADKARVAREGVDKGKGYDLWGAEPAEDIPEVLKKRTGISFKPATVMPATMKEAPIRIQKMEVVPHGGKSYNPSLSSWRDLINQEYFKEKTKEDKRIALEKEKEHIQYIIDNFDDEAEVSEASGEDEDEETEDYKLSINPATSGKRKTKAQRNRQKREKRRQELRKEIDALKATIKQLEKLPEIRDEVTEKSEEVKPKVRRTPKHLGPNVDIKEGPLEVKLSDELGDSLRKLKPEGNLLEEEVRKLQAGGKIEARRNHQRKHGRRKITEKWSYKDFK